MPGSHEQGNGMEEQAKKGFSLQWQMLAGWVRGERKGNSCS